jgi:hypothetical protein
MKTETLINPHFYHSNYILSRELTTCIDDAKPLDKLVTNAKIEDQPLLFGKSGTAAGQTIPKSYNEFTKKFDNNYTKMGLRGK